ncbi:MAG: DUF4143 domain-containing protein, partial [Candidatus Electrothrix sp. ATG1]|nr:DUF4143 domain-containing protein [Candidatus Electrothrix sp. ATG1]
LGGGGLDWLSFSRMDDLKLVNQGAVAEQFVGQHLQALLADKPNRELNYWLREGKAANAEVDFVIGVSGNIIPVEVKSGAAGTLKSLHQFMGSKQAPLAVRFDINPPSVQEVDTVITKNKQRRQVQYPLVSLPLYLVERLDGVVHAVLEQQ